MIISSLFLVLAAITLIASEEITSTVSTSDNGAEPKANLKCIACLNCKIFEVTSHSMDCEATATRCMKNGLRSGEIERSCATEATCEEAKTAPRFTSADCCAEDLCNGAAATVRTAAVTAATLTVVLAVVMS